MGVARLPFCTANVNKKLRWLYEPRATERTKVRSIIASFEPKEATVTAKEFELVPGAVMVSVPIVGALGVAIVGAAEIVLRPAIIKLELHAQNQLYPLA